MFGSKKSLHLKNVCLIVAVFTLTGALNKELLSMAAQQGAREEGGKIHKDLSEQRSSLL